MSHTYHQLIYHLVWSTKERQPLITPDIQNRLYEYMGGTLRSLACQPLLIGGMPDHVHFCVGIPPTLVPAEIIRSVKVASSKWVSQNFQIDKKFQWQEGYGAFTVGPSSKKAVLKYIKNQETHHKKRDFKEEFLWLLKNHDIEFEEKFLWK